MLVGAPSAFAAEEQREKQIAKVASGEERHKKAEAVGKKHKEHAKQKEHPKEHPDAKHKGEHPQLRLEAFALEHGDEDVARVLAEVLPEGSRVAYHAGTNKVIVLTRLHAFDYVHYILKELDIPQLHRKHREHPEHDDDGGDKYPKDGDDVDRDDDDAYPKDGDKAEGDEDKYPEDGDEADRDDDDDDDDEAASRSPLTKEALAVAIKAHIEDATKAQGGHFHVEDHKAGVTLELNLDKVHEERLATMGDGVYFACSDFKGTDGKMYDVDFFMKDADDGLVMTELYVHKEDGVARYTWHENNGVWSRKDVE